MVSGDMMSFQCCTESGRILRSASVLLNLRPEFEAGAMLRWRLCQFCVDACLDGDDCKISSLLLAPFDKHPAVLMVQSISTPAYPSSYLTPTP